VAEFLATAESYELIETRMASLATSWFWYSSKALFLEIWELRTVLAATVGVAFLVGCPLLLGELVGDAIMLL
jgi:hypothetical protein